MEILQTCSQKMYKLIKWFSRYQILERERETHTDRQTDRDSFSFCYVEDVNEKSPQQGKYCSPSVLSLELRIIETGKKNTEKESTVTSILRK